MAVCEQFVRLPLSEISVLYLSMLLTTPDLWVFVSTLPHSGPLGSDSLLPFKSSLDENCLHLGTIYNFSNTNIDTNIEDIISTIYT